MTLMSSAGYNPEMRDIFVKEGRVHGHHLLGGGAEDLVLVDDGVHHLGSRELPGLPTLLFKVR